MKDLMQNATYGANAICTKLAGTNNKHNTRKAIHASRRKKGKKKPPQNYRGLEIIGTNTSYHSYLNQFIQVKNVLHTHLSLICLNIYPSAKHKVVKNMSFWCSFFNSKRESERERNSLPFYRGPSTTPSFTHRGITLQAHSENRNQQPPK